jgi:Flp pilus assembly protein TadD
MRSISALFLLPLLTTLLLTGCASFEYRYSPEEEARLKQQVLGDFRELPRAPTLYLSEEAKQVLADRINPRWSDRRKLNALRVFLFDENELNIQYASDATLTAMEVWEQGVGNCLSMTNLFVAAAREVGLTARFRTVEVRPTWDHEDLTMIRYEHILASGDLRGGAEYIVDFLPEFVIGETASERITDGHALALYFNNVGAERVIAEDYEGAILNLRKSLLVKEDFTDAWNNLGAAYRRIGNDELAEFAYQQAIKADGANYSALSNLAQFYQLSGREKEARRFMKRVEQYRRRNPYFHYFVARILYERGDVEDAVAVLERSVELKRDEPDFYEALADGYARLGNVRASTRYSSLAEKYRQAEPQPVARSRGHRFWIQTIRVNP